MLKIGGRSGSGDVASPEILKLLPVISKGEVIWFSVSGPKTRTSLQSSCAHASEPPSL